MTSLAPYMQWAKQHPRSRFNLAGSNLLPCDLADLPGAREALELAGDNDNGYRPLVEAIAARYGVTADQVATAQGASGANFLVFAALLQPGDDVLVEQPGYDPLMGAARLLGARVTRFERRVEDAFRVDPAAVRAAMTPRTRLVVLTNTHNPTGALADAAALDGIGRLAERYGIHVLVDEVYLDSVPGAGLQPAAVRSPVFITTSSLTKSYGLAGLRCGWVLAAPEVTERVRRMRDIVDGTGVYAAERMAALAFQHLDRLAARCRRILDANGSTVRAFLDGRPNLEHLWPAGGTVVFPRLRGEADADPFVEFACRDFEVDVVPGRFFQAPAHFRIAFGGRSDALEAGLDRLGAALDAWRR